MLYVIYFVSIGFCGKSKALSGQRERERERERERPKDNTHVCNCVLPNGVHWKYTGGIPFVKFWTN
jgi:hypothetical protein